VRRVDNLTTFVCLLSRNLVASTSWNPQGLSRSLMRLLYLTFYCSKYKIVGTFSWYRIPCTRQLWLVISNTRIWSTWSRGCVLSFAKIICTRTALRSLIYVITWQLHASAVLPSDNSQYPVGRRLVGPHNRFGHCEEQEKFICPYQECNRDKAVVPTLS
jgi:hypothetical protein